MSRAAQRVPRRADRKPAVERGRSSVAVPPPTSPPPPLAPRDEVGRASGAVADSGEQQSWAARLSTWLTADAVTVSTMVVALLYGVTRPAYASFYSSLGLTPEAVGLSQPLILFRAAVHVAREAAVLGGLATVYLAFRQSIYWLMDQHSGDVAEEHPRSRTATLLTRSAAGGGVVALVVLSYEAQEPPDRRAAVLGLVSCALFVIVVVGLVRPRRHPMLRACAVLVLLGAGVSFGSYQNAAGSAGYIFLNEGRVPNDFRLVLSIYATYVQPVVLGGQDPIGLCGTPAYYQFLGSTRGVSYLLVRPQPPDHLHERPQPPYVARLQDTDYRFRMALLQVPRGDLTGAWPGPPLPCDDSVPADSAGRPASRSVS